MPGLTLGKTTRLEGAPVCPYCGHMCDAATTTEEDQPLGAPRQGDVSICAHCAGIMIFVGEPLGLRKATDDERAEIFAADPRVAVMRVAVMLTRAAKS